ncbi:DUF4350 domain-containing protein [Halarchaeum acidiphilum]|uniref:DUF4350 domain-containing protein n=1 Tax=Halarchaeum acidiphilum TaxID=489138 RepID=UPI000677F019|nr:DUF4350 domain-containing protein [Halarchaeum acidiphilum]
MNATLADADAYVVADPAAAYGSDEASAVAQFADNGGRVLLLGDTPSAATSTSSLLGLTSGTAAAGSGQPNAIAARRGMTFDADYLFDMTDNANNFQYVYGTPSGDGSTGLADGVDRAVFDAAVPVVHGETATTAIAAANVSRSSTRTTGTHAVVARNGNVAAIGDTWFLSPDGATVADNEALVGNVAGFLVSGTKTGRIATSSPRTGVGTGRTVSVGSMTTRPESAPSATNETNATA